MKIEIIELSHRMDLLHKGITYFWNCWGNDSNYQFYKNCIENSLDDKNSLPKFYLALIENEIVGSYALLTNEPGKESWPITGATFILMHKTQDKPETAKEVLKFFDWAYLNGGKMAEALDYVPMPEKVQQLVRAAWKTQVKDNKGTAIWK